MRFLFIGARKIGLSCGRMGGFLIFGIDSTRDALARDRHRRYALCELINELASWWPSCSAFKKF